MPPAISSISSLMIDILLFLILFLVGSNELCVCVCFRPPVRGVYLNYEVLDFQPQTVTPTEPRSVSYCYIFILVPPCPPLQTTDVLLGDEAPSWTDTPSTVFLSCLCTVSSSHLVITCHCPSILMFPDSPLSFAVRAPSLWLSLAPATPSGFLSPPHPCQYRNRFYRDLQLIICCLLLPPQHLESPPRHRNPYLL